jgi:hypothetical protein
MSIAAYILFTVLIICISLIIMLKTWIDYKLDSFCHADDVIETQTKILSLQRDVISLERQLYKKDENIIMNKQEQFSKLQNENFKESSRLSGLMGTSNKGISRETLQALIEGMTISIDVSTGDHDSDHRYYGIINEVMDDPASKHGVTLLVYDAKPNFKGH